MSTEPSKAHTMEMKPDGASPKPNIDQIKMRYMSGSAFSTHGEMKRLFMFILLALSGVAIVLQYQLNRMKMAEDLRKDREQWERMQEALKASPQPGTGPEGGVVKWDNMLAEEVDDSPLDDVVTDKGFKYLVRHIGNLKPGESLKAEESYDYIDLLKNPALHRGNIVSLSGLVNKVVSNISLESNQGAYTSVHRIYLVDLSGTKACVVDVLERPDGMPERTSVEADAVFIKTFKYETQDTKTTKGEIKRVPYFLAQRVTKIQRSQTRSMWSPTVTIVVVSICAVLVLVIFLMGRTGDRKSKISEVSSNAL